MPGRLSLLLVAILVVLLIHPFLDGWVVTQRLLELGLAGAILAATHHVVQTRWVFGVAVGLAVLGSGSEVVVPVAWGAPALVLRYLLATSFLSIVVGLILMDALRRSRITVEPVSGVLAGYLLLGLIWLAGCAGLTPQPPVHPEPIIPSTWANGCTYDTWRLRRPSLTT